MFYGIIFFSIRSYLNRIGKERLKSNELRFLAVNEAFGAAKEVKVGGLEEIYINRYASPAKNFAKNHALAEVVNMLPRYIFEAIAFGGILLIILFLMLQKGIFNNVLPIVTLYVFAGYRLMPALHQIYGSFTKITFVGSSLNRLHEDIQSLKSFNVNQNKGILILDKKIEFKNIYYEYPNASRTALKNISIEIPANTTVGLVGATGSGKTTTVDIILGLFEGQKGKLEVDGKKITKHK